MPNTKHFPTWKSVELGLRSSGDQYLSAILEKGFVVGRVAKAAARKIPISAAKTTAEIVRVSTSDFGLPNNTPISEIHLVAAGFGLRPCRLEVALALREQYQNQPAGEVLWIVADKIKSKGEIGYFSVGHDTRGQWLCFGCGGPDCWWGRWRRAKLSPTDQEKLIPMYLCECAWSRRGESPILAIFEQSFVR